jgi:hypothetical protein
MIFLNSASVFTSSAGCSSISVSVFSDFPCISKDAWPFFWIFCKPA